jgi:hypothetical protein
VREWVERRSTTQPTSPGAARRPLPARERRLFVASLGTDGSVLSALSTKPTLPAGNVGATRWVARRGRGGCAAGMMRDHRARSHQGDAPRRPLHHTETRVWWGRARRRPASATGTLPDRTRGGSRTAPTGTLRSNPWCHGPGARVLPASAPTVVQTRRCAPTCMRRFQGRAPVCPYEGTPFNSTPQRPPTLLRSRRRHLPVALPRETTRSTAIPASTRSRRV